jgi:hypothetical protein
LLALANLAKRVLFAPPAASTDAGEDVASFRFRSLSIVLFFPSGTIKDSSKHHQQRRDAFPLSNKQPKPYLSADVDSDRSKEYL